MTTATFDSAEAIIKFSSGIELNWDIFTIPIPEHVVVYSTDQKKFKVGDGHHLYQELVDGPSIAGIIAHQNSNEIDIFSHLRLVDNNKIIIPNGGIFVAGNVSLADLNSRLNIVISSSTLRDANMVVLSQRLANVDNSVNTSDNAKLTIVNNHKLAPGILPEAFTPNKVSPLSIMSVKAYSDKACTTPVTRFAYDSTYYIKVEATHDTVDISLLSYMLVDDNVYTTVTNIGDGIFRIDVKESPADGLLNFTATITYSTDTVTDHLSVALLGYVDPATNVSGIIVYSDITCKLPVANLNTDTTYYAKISINSIIDVSNITFGLTESSGLIHISNLGSGKFKLDVAEPVDNIISTLTGTAAYGTILSTLTTLVSLRAYIPALHITNIGVFTDSDCTITTTQFNPDSTYYAKITGTYGNLTIDKVAFTLTNTNTYVNITPINNNIFKIDITEPPLTDTIILNGSVSYRTALVSGAIAVTLKPLIPPIIISGVGVYSDLACTVSVALLNPNTTYYAKIIASYGSTDVSQIIFSLTSNNTHAVVAANLGLGVFRIDVGSSTIAADITFNGTAQHSDSTSSGINYLNNTTVSNLPLNTDVTLVGKGGPRVTLNPSTNYTSSTTLNNLPLNTSINMVGKGGPRTVANSGTNYVFPAYFSSASISTEAPMPLSNDGDTYWWSYPVTLTSSPNQIWGFDNFNVQLCITGYDQVVSNGVFQGPPSPYVTNLHVSGEYIIGNVYAMIHSMVNGLTSVEYMGDIYYTLTVQPYTNYNAGPAATETINGTTYTFPGQSADGSTWNTTTFNVATGSNPNSTLTIPAGGNINVAYTTYNAGLVATQTINGTTHTFLGQSADGSTLNTTTVNTNTGSNPNSVLTIPAGGNINVSYTPHSVNYTANTTLNNLPLNTDINMVGKGGPRNTFNSSTNYTASTTLNNLPANTTINMVGKGGGRVVGSYGTNWVWPANYNGDFSSVLVMGMYENVPTSVPQIWSTGDVSIYCHSYDWYYEEGSNEITSHDYGQYSWLTASWFSVSGNIIHAHLVGNGYDFGTLSWTLTAQQYPIYADGPAATETISGIPYTFPGQSADGTWNATTINVDTNTTNAGSTLTIPSGGNIQLSYGSTNLNYTSNTIVRDLPLNTNITLTGKGGPRSVSGSVNTGNYVWPATYNGDYDHSMYYNGVEYWVPQAFPQLYSLSNVSQGSDNWLFGGITGQDNPTWAIFGLQPTPGWFGNLHIIGNIVYGNYYVGDGTFSCGTLSWTLVTETRPTYNAGTPATEVINGTTYTFPGQSADGSTWNNSTYNVSISYNPNSALDIPAGGNIQVSYTYHTPGTPAYETINGTQYTFQGQAIDGTWNNTIIIQNTGSNPNSVLTIPTSGNINVSYTPFVISTITGYTTIHMLQYIPPVAHYNMITSVYAGASTGDTNFHSFQHQAVTIDHVGNIIAVGNCSAPGHGNTNHVDPVVVKYDSNLNVISKKIYTVTDNFSFNSVCVDSNNNIYCVGGGVSVDGGISQPPALSLVVKFDSNLNLVNGWVYHTTSNFCSIIYHPSNFLFILGSGYLIKMSTDLTTVIDANLINRLYTGLAIDPNGSIYCYGCTTYKNTATGSFVWQFGSLIEKRDVNLTILKSVELGVGGHNCIMITDMAFDQNNNVICSGFNGNSTNSANDTDVTNSTYGTKYDTYQDISMMVVKLDNNLNILKYISYKYTEDYITTSYGNLRVCVDAANNISAFGIGSVIQGLVKFDDELNILISKRYGINDTWSANATDIVNDTNNNLYCTGWHMTNEEVNWSSAYDTTISRLPKVIPSGTFASQNVGITLIDLTYTLVNHTVSCALHIGTTPSGSGTGNDNFRNNLDVNITALGMWTDFTFVPTLESIQLV